MLNGIEQSKEQALDTLYDYFINETHGNPIAFGKWEKFSSALIFIGASSGVYSWPPAWQYAKDKPSWLKYSIVISNPISNVLFLAKATDDLFDAIAIEFKKPKELKDILQLPSKKELFSKYTKMVSGSFICAVPFAIAVYLFPVPDCTTTACLSTIVGHSLLANMILHAISWNLILTPQFWYYRLPFLPFEKAYQAIQKSCHSRIKEQLLGIEQQESLIYQKYKQLLSQFFSTGTDKMIDQYLKNKKNPGNGLNILKNNHHSTMADFIAAVGENKNLHAESSSAIARIARSIDYVLSNGVIGFLGATFMLAGTIGWTANPFFLGLKEGLNLLESIGAGILPAYSTAILCAFYGAAVGNQIYQYLTTWRGGISNKFSLEARQYPKTFVVFLLINTYMAAFAYGTAQQLIRTIFEDEKWDDIRPYLEDISMPALQLLSFVPLAGLFNAVIRKSIAKFGAESDDQFASRLLAKMTVLIQRLQQMKGEQLVDNLKKFSSDQKKAIGISTDQFDTDLKTLADLQSEKQGVINSSQKYTSSCCDKFMFWKRRQIEEVKEKQPLLVNYQVPPSYS